MPTTQAYLLKHFNGYTFTQGFHVACGRSLTQTVVDRDYTCMTPPEPYGKWDHALGNYEWDAVTIQAYPGGTGESEVAATALIIEEATSGGRNQDCVFYLYLAWPSKSESINFSDRILTPFEGDTSPVFLSVDFLDYWESKISSLFPELDIRVIPTGVALATIDQKLREINIPPYADSYDLYRDVHHMNFTDGRYVAMATMLSTVTGIHPSEIVYPNGYFSDFNSEFVELANEVVWFTITNDPRTHINVTPEVGMKHRMPDVLEVSFLGTLWKSDHLEGWSEVVDVTSPYRINPNNQSSQFFYSASQ